MSQTSSTERFGSTISLSWTGIFLPSNSIIIVLLSSGLAEALNVTDAKALRLPGSALVGTGRVVGPVPTF
jgi:hypothetical protein